MKRTRHPKKTIEMNVKMKVSLLTETLDDEELKAFTEGLEKKSYCFISEMEKQIRDERKKPRYSQTPNTNLLHAGGAINSWYQRS